MNLVFDSLACLRGRGEGRGARSGRVPDLGMARPFLLMKNLRVRYVIGCCVAFGLWPVEAAESLKTESRTPFRHVIPLRDAEGNQIIPPPEFDEQGKHQEARGQPVSMSQTCGRCHEYSAIGQGWHFNAGNTNVKSGRPGEPWILTDAATRTQIPLSYRGWPGTFKPAHLGISDFDFLVAFARHYPGGGVGDPPKEKMEPFDVRMRRMQVTGGLEIDCMICHAKSGGYSHEARAKALGNENFKWAPTIASELGIYGASRMAKTFADSWRPPRPAPTNLPPVKYERDRFDLANEVKFEVTRRPPVESCYYCHTAESGVGDNRWHSDRDVHIRAGMSCVDCHRNGVDHMIVRGYEGETADRTPTAEAIDQRVRVLLRDHPELKEGEARTRAEAQVRSEVGRVETLSCRGCHYGTQEGLHAGRLGAPHPEHAGFPPIHFEKLSCTACHSGPVPQDATEIVHTSMAHKLGLPGPVRGENTAPAIVQPVFLRDANGKIAPHRAVWPSYWGLLADDKVKPLLPEEVAKAAGDKLPAQPKEEVERDPYNTRPLTEAQIRDVLTALSTGRTNGQVVYVAAGKLFKLEGGAVQSAEHAVAKPYTWALGHDVRPKAQSVGYVKGCADCHSQDSPIYFAKVTARGPIEAQGRLVRSQGELRGEDLDLVSTFAFTFLFRPMLKVITFVCAGVVLAALLGRFMVWAGGWRHRSGGGRT